MIEFEKEDGTKAFVNPQQVSAVDDVPIVAVGGFDASTDKKPDKSIISLNGGEKIRVRGDASETMKKLKGKGTPKVIAKSPQAGINPRTGKRNRS